MSDMPIQHSGAYRTRRFWNWFPMGLTYAFLYMGRYNLTVSKNALGEAMTKEDFGLIFAAGTITYAFAFLLNGPLTDKIGGRKGILIAAMGSAVCNLAMGLFIQFQIVAGGGDSEWLVPVFCVMYAVNMYFQSFGAVSIVKVNAHWFHVRERGGFGGIFGTMISSGIFFAFTVNAWVLDWVTPEGTSQMANSMVVFYLPAAILLVMFVVEYVLLRDTPGLAGHKDFDTGDASSGDMGSNVGIFSIMKKVVTNPIILTVALIEFCTGVLRNGVMHWFPFYAKEVLVLPSNHYLVHGDWGQWWYTVLPLFVLSVFFFFRASRAKGLKVAWFTICGALMFIAPFMQGGWGGILMVSGVIGSNVAGWVSDLFFQSRRAPAAGGLYGGLIVATIAMLFVLGGTTTAVSWVKEAKEGEKVGPGYDELREGDEILSIEGKGDLKDWSHVSAAVACLPAICKKSTWDADLCMCTTHPTKAADAEARAQAKGSIAAVVMRDGKETALLLHDPKPIMRAGDKRKLPAGPGLVLSPYLLGLVIFLMSLCVIGSHGLLSGTATMDFGGRRGAATAVGLIDGFVYLGTGLQSIVLGYLTTKDWSYWPMFLLPFAIIGFLLSLRIWNAKPGSGGGGH